jgi:phosphopentomutase
MARAFILVLDSVGIGAAPDAAQYDDVGSDTLGHIAEACAEGRADRDGVRSGPLRLPNLIGLGLGEAYRTANGRVPPGLESTATPTGRYGCAVERP